MTKRKKILLVILIMSFSILFSACSDFAFSQANQASKSQDLKVHFIDVGQGDAILIQKDNQNMLIDAGDNPYEQFMVNYLKEHGVSKVDFLIATHPHADHIGGMDAVIQNFDIGQIIMPKIAHNSRTFEDVLLAIKDKGLKIHGPKIGETYKLGDANWRILAPNSENYSNTNNYSVVVKLEYGSRSFLFTGDAEKRSEQEMLEKHRRILQASVLKVGHHGGNTSTNEDFLKVVSPEIAVMQVGENNIYGHPHSEVMERLEKHGVTIYRNDFHGNVMLQSDGKSIKVDLQSNPNLSQEKNEINKNQENSIQYIGNKNSKVLHLESCQQLPIEKNRMHFSNRQEAIQKGYRPCQRCKP